MIITHAHMRNFGYCNRGARPFFLRHGLDWARFRRFGLPAADLEATGDAMALALVDAVRRVEVADGPGR